MDEFTRNLRQQIRASMGKPSHQKVNPFVVIGLTEAILDLHLNEEQMFAAVRSYVRQLASQVHPDRRPANVSEERQKQIFEAFEELDDRMRFSEALKEFRNLKAEDRRETNLLRSALLQAKDKLENYESQARALVEDRKKFDQERALFNSDVIKLRSENEALGLAAETHRRTVRELKNGLRDERLRANSLEGYFSSLGFRPESRNSPPFAFDARWVAIAHTAITRRSLNKRGLTGYLPGLLSDRGVTELGLTEVLKRNELDPMLAGSLLTRFDEEIEYFNSSARGGWGLGGHLVLSVFVLSSGRPRRIYGYGFPTRLLRVIGSARHDPKLFKYKGYDRNRFYTNLSAFLVTGSRLVLARTRCYNGELENGRFSSVFNTSNVILGVG